jgi:hypothetical protein
MTEGTGLLEAKPPRKVRCSKLLFEPGHREIAPNLIEYVAKVQPLRSQPTGECPLTEVHLLGDYFCLRLAMRQKWRNGVLYLCPKWTYVGWACRNGVLAALHHQVIEIRVIA